MPKVSVIIPTHNRAAWLPRTIESAHAAGDDLEVIVVDDGSTDETPRVCRAMPGIRYVRLERNAGQANARNVGIRASAAEFIAFLDDDDLRLPGSLTSQIRKLEAAPEAALVYAPVHIGDVRHRLPTGRLAPAECPRGDVFWRMLESNFIQVASVVARRARLVEVGLFDTSLVDAEDWDMWLRLAEHHTIETVEEPVAIYRQSDPTSGQMTSHIHVHTRHAQRVQAKGLRLPRAARSSRGAQRRTRRAYLDHVCDGLIGSAADAVGDSERRRALTIIAASLRLRPTRPANLAALGLLLTAGSE